MNPKIKELRKKAMQLPLTPGVYLMKNSSSEIIYVGKAKALKNRVSQYFGSEHNHTVKVRKMVENVDDFDVILTDSEFEALVLECSLIKQHSPKYNILLKDDKGYSYIKVTPGKWRNIYAVLQREDDGAKYIGPYMSSFAARNTVDEAKKIFRLPQCNKVFPRDFGKSRPCLNFFIGQCSGVCSGKVPFSQYNEAVEDALAFIKEGGTAALDELAGMLGLPAAPEFIESYDISHTAGSDNVAGMIVFRNGEPYRRGYRRFMIKGFTGQDDYASMAEVLDRRFTRYEEEKESGEGFGRLPDLILLDGGKGQVSAVEPILKKHGLENIPLFGMVKDGSHRTRAIAKSGGEIAFTSKRRAFTLVAEIQEEVHRFAVTYHRQKHKASALSSTLTDIPGVGPSRAKSLLRHFKTVTAIKNASVDELKNVSGISDSMAQTIYDALHPES